MDLAAYLRHEKIVTNDPYDQENLRPKTKIEVGQNAAVFDNYYQVNGERIYCNICGGHRHYKGITGILEDGTRILFGSKCAADYFGPEITKLHAAELRRRTTDAQARFKILSIQAELETIEEWLSSYRPLVTQCATNWVVISSRYPETFREIMNHLQKNNGRFVESTVVEIAKSEGGVHRHFDDKILSAVRDFGAIPYLTQVAQQLSLVDVFIAAVSGLRHQPNKQSINNLNRLFVRMVRAAETIDSCLFFTHEFFKPEKLLVLTQWTERRREERLGLPEDKTNRNIGGKFSKIMGNAFPLPKKSLTDTILEIDSLKILAVENAEPLQKSALG